MTTIDIFSFSLLNQPGDEQFHEIAQLMTNDLRRVLGQNVHIIKESIEPQRWVHLELASGDKSGDFLYGIAVFRLMNGLPSISSVLLKFRNGVRVREGRNTILTSTYEQEGWQDFVWKDDEFLEWECDNVSEISSIR